MQGTAAAAKAVVNSRLPMVIRCPPAGLLSKGALCMEDDLQLDRQSDTITIIRLNRADARNALTMNMAR
ncbi:MAG TPA: hypothetical protein VF475_00090 [Sphingobium sp.]